MKFLFATPTYSTAGVFAGAFLLCTSMGLAQARGMGNGAPAAGQNGTQDSGMNSQMNGMAMAGQGSPSDKMFLKTAMQGGLAEVQLGQLTLQKSNNDQVKQFAQRMIADHGKLNDQMKPIAQQLGVMVPTEPAKKDKAVMSKLQSLSGPAYDQAYLKDMVKDHKQDLSQFQMEASSGSDPSLKDAANQGSQVIAQHLQMVQQLAKDQNVAVANN